MGTIRISVCAFINRTLAICGDACSSVALPTRVVSQLARFIVSCWPHNKVLATVKTETCTTRADEPLSVLSQGAISRCYLTLSHSAISQVSQCTIICYWLSLLCLVASYYLKLCLTVFHCKLLAHQTCSPDTLTRHAH